MLSVIDEALSMNISLDVPENDDNFLSRRKGNWMLYFIILYSIYKTDTLLQVLSVIVKTTAMNFS